MTNKEPAAPKGKTVAFGDRPIGDGQPTFVIAEGGVNHDGDIEKALQLVDVAAAAGADAVKFQMFRADDLVTASANPAGYQRVTGVSSQREMLTRLELSDADFRQIADRCAEQNIHFLATPFGLGDVERLLALNVRAIKIASTDVNNMPLLRKAAATGLPLIVSTGASTAEEIETAIVRLRSMVADDRLILLHCISGYPAPIEAANLRAIGTLRRVANVPCGFSDHTSSTSIGGWATAAGACILEKHFTLDRHAHGPDHAMSLSPHELAAYIKATREVERALGTGQLGMTAVQTDVRTVARRSVVAAQPITAGTVITLDMLAVKRPGGGIPPDEFDAVPGKAAAVDIPADTIITWDMLR